jgi:DNA-binding transcriptional MerR regulator
VTTYRISQLAKRVGVKPTTLRFYEQAGLLPADRSESGYRLYDQQAVERLGFIASGKHLGLPLEQIRDLLAMWEDELCTDVRARLRPMLTARIADVEQQATELAAFTNRARQALAELDAPPRPGRCPRLRLVAPQQPSAPVPGEFCRRHPPAPSTPAPIACTLTGDHQLERITRWRDVLVDADREHIHGGLVPPTCPARRAGGRTRCGRARLLPFHRVHPAVGRR